MAVIVLLEYWLFQKRDNSGVEHQTGWQKIKRRQFLSPRPGLILFHHFTHG